MDEWWMGPGGVGKRKTVCNQMQPPRTRQVRSLRTVQFLTCFAVIPVFFDFAAGQDGLVDSADSQGRLGAAELHGYGDLKVTANLLPENRLLEISRTGGR